MFAVVVLVTSRAGPAKLMLSRLFDFVLAAIVDVLDRRRRDTPLETS